MFYALIALTLVVAVIDWWAAFSERKPWEYVFKPLTMVVLIAATFAMGDPAGETIRLVMILGLVLSLAGDVFLMLGEHMFLQGLVAFLLAHVAYVVGLAMLGVTLPGLVIGAVAVALALALVAPRIVRGASGEDPRMGNAVAGYMAVISIMVMVAVGTGNPWAIVGASLFYFSDACIGWNRFVKPLPARSLLVMVTYHVGQIGLVMSLVT